MLEGLDAPIAVRFATFPDTRVFVAEKSGLIKAFDDLGDSTPTIVADLRTETHDFHDRGLLGIELDPNFPASPRMWAIYSRNAAIGGTAPRWPDDCPDPPGGNDDGCVISGRLVKLTLDPLTNRATSTTPLIDDWCQQYPSHSVGNLEIGPDGALYASGGDGASFTFIDWGQRGDPTNPCGDPPTGAGGVQTPPTAEGGALRSQDLRTRTDPQGLDGALIRVDPDTGAGLPSNPLGASANANERRIVAHGFRNPFRFAMRPGTSEVWIGDVGMNDYEEIDRLQSPADSTVDNFGWPCYEGANRQAGYDAANLALCENLYASPGAVTGPHFAYRHDEAVVPGGCGLGSGSATSGVSFYPGGTYPALYDGALFFTDYARGCIWVMPAGSNGLPDPSRRANFAVDAGTPVDLQIGPGGDLFYVDLFAGAIQRISYLGADEPPTARATASPTSGEAPLVVDFDGTGSTDPENDQLTYAWDLDGDGQFDDSTVARPTFTYTTPGTRTVRLRVADTGSGTDVSDPITIDVSNHAPVAAIDRPAPGTTFAVGDLISFSGSGSDQDEGTLPASSMSWTLIQHHCPAGGCHEHVVTNYQGVAGGSFSAPDHSYPSHLELRLTVTDSLGATDTDSLRLDPKTASIALASSPVAALLTLNGETGTGAITRTVIVGSANTVSAATSAGSHRFASWSDGGAQTHIVTAPAGGLNLTAAYAANRAPIANAAASPVSGTAPLGVTFSAAGSTDPDGDPITYAWDLDGDGQFDDSSLAQPSFTYTAAGTYAVRLRVADDRGGSTVSSPVTITVQAAPVPTLSNPSFAVNVSGWTLSGSGTGLDRSTSVFDSSPASGRLHHTSLLSALGSSNRMTAAYSGTFQAGATYRVTIRARTSSSTARINGELGTTSAYGSGFITGRTTWGTLTVNWTPAQTTSQGSLRLFATSASRGQSIYVDSIATSRVSG